MVLDGVPRHTSVGIDFMEDIARRKSGAPGTTKRRESDQPMIRSGVYRVIRPGVPVHFFLNRDARPEEYLSDGKARWQIKCISGRGLQIIPGM